MQSLGQAVYRFVCMNSRDGEGVGKRAIIKEMNSRDYRPPLDERVGDALQGYLNSGFIRLTQGLYVKTQRYWEKKPSEKRAIKANIRGVA